MTRELLRHSSSSASSSSASRRSSPASTRSASSGSMATCSRVLQTRSLVVDSEGSGCHPALRLSTRLPAMGASSYTLPLQGGSRVPRLAPFRGVLGADVRTPAASHARSSKRFARPSEHHSPGGDVAVSTGQGHAPRDLRLRGCLLECGEAYSCAAGERDDAFAFVAVERLAPGGDRVVVAAGCLEHFGQVAEGICLKFR
jgi:hypothetical protein